MPWYKIEIPASDVDGSAYRRLQADLEKILLTRKVVPPDAALFACTRSDSGETLYFTPGAAMVASHLIAEFYGVECEPPPAGAGTRLLVG